MNGTAIALTVGLLLLACFAWGFVEGVIESVLARRKARR